MATFFAKRTTQICLYDGRATVIDSFVGEHP